MQRLLAAGKIFPFSPLADCKQARKINLLVKQIRLAQIWASNLLIGSSTGGAAGRSGWLPTG
jgi:hypothetical protein